MIKFKMREVELVEMKTLRLGDRFRYGGDDFIKIPSHKTSSAYDLAISTDFRGIREIARNITVTPSGQDHGKGKGISFDELSIGKHYYSDNGCGPFRCCSTTRNSTSSGNIFLLTHEGMPAFGMLESGVYHEVKLVSVEDDGDTWIFDYVEEANDD